DVQPVPHGAGGGEPAQQLAGEVLAYVGPDDNLFTAETSDDTLHTRPVTLRTYDSDGSRSKFPGYRIRGPTRNICWTGRAGRAKPGRWLRPSLSPSAHCTFTG